MQVSNHCKPINAARAALLRRLQLSLRKAERGKTGLGDYSRFCAELETYFGQNEAASSFGFSHRIKVSGQGGFSLQLKGEAVPVFSLELLTEFAGREVFVSAETAQGIKFLTIFAEGEGYFTSRVYHRGLNRFYYQRNVKSNDSLTYILAVGPENEIRFLDHRVVFNFAWKPGDLVLAQVAEGDLQGFVSRDRGEPYPLTRVSLPDRPATLLVGAPLTAQMLAKVDGVLEKNFFVCFQRRDGIYHFSLADREYCLTAKDFEGIPDPLKARLILTLVQGRPSTVEIRWGSIRRRLKYVVAKNGQGAVVAVAPRNLFHRPRDKGETHIVEGHFSEVASGKNSAGERVYFEEINFFGARERIRSIPAALVDDFSPRRCSFVVHEGRIYSRFDTEEPDPRQQTRLHLRAYYLAEWSTRAVEERGFYHALLKRTPKRDLAGERRWQRDFLQKMEAGVDGRVIFKPAGSTYREAAAYLSALAYVASGRSALPPRAVGVVAQRVLPLAAAAGEKMFSQAAAWLWRFPDTQDILFSLFPHLDLRDREFGGFVRGAFKRDPFLWDGIFRRLMG